MFKIKDRDILIVHRVMKVHEKPNGDVDLLTKGTTSCRRPRVACAGPVGCNAKTLGRAIGTLRYVGMVTSGTTTRSLHVRWRDGLVGSHQQRGMPNRRSFLGRIKPSCASNELPRNSAPAAHSKAKHAKNETKTLRVLTAHRSPVPADLSSALSQKAICCWTRTMACPHGRAVRGVEQEHRVSCARAGSERLPSDESYSDRMKKIKARLAALTATPFPPWRSRRSRCASRAACSRSGWVAAATALVGGVDAPATLTGMIAASSWAPLQSSRSSFPLIYHTLACATLSGTTTPSTCRTRPSSSRAGRSSGHPGCSASAFSRSDRGAARDSRGRPAAASVIAVISALELRHAACAHAGRPGRDPAARSTLAPQERALARAYCARPRTAQATDDASRGGHTDLMAPKASLRCAYCPWRLMHS